MIKAIFFDIDGTLVSLKTKVYPASTKAALERLHEKGILLFVATGRSRFEIESEGLLDGLYFDGYLTNNGQDGYDKDGNTIYGKPLTTEDARVVFDWAKERNYPCWAVTARESLLDFRDENVDTAFEAIHTQLPKFGDIYPMLDEPIYKIVFFQPREVVAEAVKLTKHCRTTQWFELGHDIISVDGGKRNAMLDIIEHYGISPDECMSFGDSENDIEMLQASGIGVAMGNATEEAKAAADYVTDDCDDDGILHALEHFGIL